jgi:hypothetical protein
MKPETECNWMGVGGKVVDLKGSPIVGLIVRVYGFLDGKIIQINSATSTGTVFGDGGYEITLADHPVASYERVWIQLSNLEGAILSDKTYINTTGTCDKNLVIINFRQIR